MTPVAVGVAGVVVAGIDPSRRLRSPDGAVAAERPLALTLTQCRIDAERQARALVGDLPLAEIVAATAAPVPRRGHLSARELDRLDLRRGLDEYVADFDLGDDRSGTDSSRLIYARDGIDRNLLPEGSMRRQMSSYYGARRANPAGVVAAVCDGATVVVKGIDEAIPRLNSAVEPLEVVVGARSGLILYLGSPVGRGWGPHHDHHDVVILQAGGRKRWTVYEPVAELALRGHTPYRTSDRIAFVVEMAPGDLLYLPRGWGHEVENLTELALHATIPLSRLVAPFAFEVGVQPSLVGGVGGSVGVVDPADLFTASAVRHAGAAWRAQIPTRADPRFGDTARSVVEGVRPDQTLRLSAPGGVALTVDPPDPGRVEVALCGLSVTMPAAGLAGLAVLATSGWTTAAAVAEAVGDVRTADALVDALLRAGVIELSPATERAPACRSSSIAAPTRVLPRRSEFQSIAPLGDVDVADRLRLPDPGRPEEVALAASLAVGRAAADRHIVSAFPGMDLARLVQRTDRPELGHGRAAEWVLPSLAGSAAIDEVVAWHDVEAPRSAMAAGGDPRNHRLPVGVHRQPHVDYSPWRLQATRVAELLDGGSTLVLLGIDEVIPRLSPLCEAIERVVGTRSGINAYISRGVAPGFGAHWDDHDVLVLQVAGTKAWEVYEPSAPFPNRGHISWEVSSDLVWQGVLRPGEWLRVPRGWGHRVSGNRDMSIHFTFPCRVPSASLVLEHASATHPDLLGAAGRLTDAWPDLVEAATSWWRARVPSRARQRMSVLAKGRPDAVRLSVPGGVFVDEAASTAESPVLAFAGRRHRVERWAFPVLSVLASGLPTSYDDLVVAAAGASNQVDALLADLLLVGVLEPEPTGVWDR